MPQSNEQRARFAVLLSESPAADVRGAAARRLLRAAHAAGHELLPVLFYGDAVLAPRAPDAAGAWRSLAEATGVRLAVCPAACRRRGLNPDDGATWEQMGLPAWLDLVLTADRVLRL